jgi:hypothetical protein
MPDVLGVFEQAVLVAIVKLGNKAYGRAILREVETRLERKVAAVLSTQHLIVSKKKG